MAAARSAPGAAIESGCPCRTNRYARPSTISRVTMAPSVTKGRRLWRRAVWSGRRHTPRLSNRCPMPCQSGVTGRVARQTKTARQAGIEASSTVPHCQGASAHPKAPTRRRAVVAGSRPNVGSSSHQSQTSPDTRPRLRRRIAARSGVPAPPWMKTRIWRSLVERATSRNEGSRAARVISSSSASGTEGAVLRSGGAYGASVESMGARCRSTTATAVVESGDARGSSETRSGGRAYARCSTSSVALSDTGLASSKRPSFPLIVIWRGKLTETTAPATGAPAGSRTSPITRKGRGARCAAAAEVAHTTTSATPSPFGITRTATRLLRHTTLVPAELAVQGGGIDAEHLGGAGLVAALALQHPGDVGTLDHVEGGVGVRPLRDEGLDAALRQLVGQGREVDRRCLAEHHRPLEGVLELADVAGPVVGEQRALRVFRERLRLLVALLGDAAQELLPQDLDIVAPVAQWREMDGDHVQPVVQVGTEAAALDVVLEVAVGGRHDPDVHGNGLGTAHGDRLPLLQHAQQLHLRGGRHLADLVQEERAAARRGEQTLLVPNRTRERSLHVAEQLGLEEALRERAAVQRKESAIRARGQLVDVARDDLLPRARLSLDQHRALGGRHLLGELQHLREGARLAQRLHEPGALAPPDLLLELLVLGLEEALLRRAPANRDEVVVRERLLDVVKRPLVHRLDRALERGLGGHQDDRGLRVLVPHRGEDLGARNARHLGVG